MVGEMVVARKRRSLHGFLQSLPSLSSICRQVSSLNTHFKGAMVLILILNVRFIQTNFTFVCVAACDCVS